jgi:putative transposase
MAYAGSKVNVTCFDLKKQLPSLRKECAWLKEINSQSLQSSIIHLDVAYTKFFKGHRNFPKYKSKKQSVQTFEVPQRGEIKEGKFTMPKFKEGIKIIQDRPFDGVIKKSTISKTPTGKYFVSILVETNCTALPKNKISKDNTIGVDLGIAHFLTTSNGDKIKNPRFLSKSLAKLKYIQKKYSKFKGKKAKYKFRKIHEKVANQRRDFLQKVSTQLVNSHDTIALETLNIKKMTKENSLSFSISDASWGMFVRMIEYKAKWYGVNVLKIGEFEPSSKTCSCCGFVNRNLTISDRQWSCPKCNSSHDRDINASINIKNFALKKLCTEHTLENCNELPTMVGVLTYKASNCSSCIRKMD